MAPVEPVSLRINELRRPFTRDLSVRRLATRLQLETSHRVLEVGGGLDGLAIPLAKEIGVSVMVADWDDAVLEAIRERVRASGLSQKVEVRRVEADKLSFRDGEFQAAVVHTGPALLASQAARTVSRAVAPDGRLAVLAVTRVGRFPNAQITSWWEPRAGEPLYLPRELLHTFAAAELEPETAESLSDLDLDGMYRAVEKDLGADERSHALREEIALFRGQGGKSTFSFTSLVGRRRKAGERPAAPRSGA